MKKFLLASLFAVVALTGCATPTPNHKLDYGVFTLRNDAISIVNAYLSQSLKDYDSAKIIYQEGHPKRAQFFSRAYGTQAVGNHFHVSVNAKNSYGGYTGFEQYVFVFRGKELKALIAPSESVGQHVIFDDTNGGKRG